MLASTGVKRSPAAPDVPTITESGVPGYVVESWQAVFAPAKTPPQIVRTLNAAVVRALTDKATVEKLTNTAYTAESSSPEALAKFLKTDTQQWESVIKTTGLKID